MGVHETARRIAFKHKPQRCEICNIDAKKLDVHHKDDNEYNNKIENLLVLCSSCHHKIDRRINNIFSNSNSVKNMARTLRIKNVLGLVERDELGRYKKGEYMGRQLTPDERRMVV